LYEYQILYRQSKEISIRGRRQFVAASRRPSHSDQTSMPPLTVDAGQQLEIDIRAETVAAFRFTAQTRIPEGDFIDFASARDSQQISLSQYHIRLAPPIVAHTDLRIYFLIDGSAGRPYRIVVRLSQAGQPLASERAGDFPQLIIIEPSYGDTARNTGAIANDYHAPAVAGPGEVFVRRVYDALTRNAERWSKTVLIVTFDEHGGFFDHVSPPMVSFKPPSKARYSKAFESLRVPVPGFVVSPLVSPKRVCSTLLDHTSVLQFLAEKFTPGVAYSAAVDERMKQGVGSASAASTSRLLGKLSRLRRISRLPSASLSARTNRP
jgi:hypothetical protein